MSSKKKLRTLLGLLLLAVATAAARATDVAKEYKIKAVFLYNLTKFVEWPAECFPSDDAPIVIGVLGENPFGTELEELVRDRRVNGRSIKIVGLSAVEDAPPVHVLFIGASEERSFLRWLKPRAGVLTVGESSEFATADGMVIFTTIDDRVRFAINAESAQQAGLKISAQLQKLATTVRKNREMR